MHGRSLYVSLRSPGNFARDSTLNLHATMPEVAYSSCAAAVRVVYVSTWLGCMNFFIKAKSTKRDDIRLTRSNETPDSSKTFKLDKFNSS